MHQIYYHKKKLFNYNDELLISFNNEISLLVWSLLMAFIKDYDEISDLYDFGDFNYY